MNYKGYTIENRNNIWVIFDNNGNQMCDHVGCELEFTSEKEAQSYIDEQLI